MKYKILAEFLFIILTIFVAWLIMRKVDELLPLNPFRTVNYFSIIVFLLYTRYIFLLKFTPFSHTAWIKGILMLISIPFLLYLIDSFYDFTKMLNEEGIEFNINSDSKEERVAMAEYTKNEFFFFLVGAIITCIVMPIRMIISIYRVYNNKGIV